jgi:excisionase family DNA binding protein
MVRDIFTTYQIARFCKVDIATVTNWIDGGKLSAYKTPGGHRRINKNELLVFLKKYTMPIPGEILGTHPKVLIVDDEKIIVDVITRALNRSPWEFEIWAAYDGFEAGLAVTSFHPDLVILDIKLPGIDGYKVLKSIKSNPDLADIKVLAVSGKDIYENQNKIIRSGADHFLSKPLDIPELYAVVARLLKLPVEELMESVKK